MPQWLSRQSASLVRTRSRVQISPEACYHSRFKALETFLLNSLDWGSFSKFLLRLWIIGYNKPLRGFLIILPILKIRQLWLSQELTYILLEAGEEMSHIMDIPDDDIAHAIQKRKKIVWLEDPLKFRYLREGIFNNWRYEQIGPNNTIKGVGEFAKLVGYEVVVDKKTKITIQPEDKLKLTIKLNDSQKFSRRFWWLKPHDRDLDPEGCYKDHAPSEAVVPSSISLFRTSEKYILSEYYQEDGCVK